MSRKKGLMNKLKSEEAVKDKDTATAFLFNQKTSKPKTEFEKKRQTIYLTEDLVQAVKYKAFKEDISMTEIFNKAVKNSLSEEELSVGIQKARSEAE